MEAFQTQTNRISRETHAALRRERVITRQKKLNSLLCRAQIPRRYTNASLDFPAPSQLAAYRFGKHFVDSFERRLETGAGALIYGGIGTGKTHLACAISNALMGDMRPTLYCTALEAIQAVKASWRRDSATTELDVYAAFSVPQLLILYEIGVQFGTDTERLILTGIADIRSRNCLPTIGISNLGPEYVCELLGERTFDRLIGYGAEMVPMHGTSLRIMR
ncbi:MAG: ATP-binding protein [Methylococcaceae bacterium]